MVPDTGTSKGVALITGAGRGIGRAIACSLGAQGWSVAVNDIDSAPAMECADAVRTCGASAAAFPADVGNPKAAAQLVAAVEAELGPVAVLVNNAGIASSGHGVHKTSSEEVELLFRTHALASFSLCRAVLPGMRQRRFGRIIMISSAAAQFAPPNSAPYTMAKSALEALARSIAVEGERYGITTNIVAPGFVNTRLGQAVLDRVASYQDSIDNGLLPSMIDPSEIAASVLHLVGSDGSQINGQRITVGLLSGPAAP